ncbi:MAG: SDR family NAD(P)-dependent oxidoreductase [Planctomycetota bacterium]
MNTTTRSTSTTPSMFDGLHVVVTGASGELGGAVARLFAARGAQCHLPVRTRAQTTGSDARLRFVAGVDLLDESSVAAFYRELPALWASIHCAGGFAAKPFADTSVEDLQSQLATNTTTAFVCAREAVRKLRAAGQGGRIVNVVARQALEPARGAGMVAYTMSKAAVAAMTRALAEEVVGDGIAVNAIAPSTLDTPSNRTAMPAADFSRWVRLDDAARWIVELASPGEITARGSIVTVYGRAP